MDDINLNDGSTHQAKRMKYASYSESDMEVALEKIKTKELTYGAASLIYKIPKTTLFNKVQQPVNLRRGNSTTLTKGQEDELAQWIFLYAACGDPRTKRDIQIAAGDIANLDSDTTKHFKNGMPTTGWIDGFLKRYPDVVYRTPEVLSKSSSMNSREDFAKMWRNI